MKYWSSRYNPLTYFVQVEADTLGSSGGSYIVLYGYKLFNVYPLSTDKNARLS